MKSLVRVLLLILSRMHPKNWTRKRWAYPQLWYSWPIKRGTEARARLERCCGFLAGHELSMTEWGYGGGKFVDHNCRWCDKQIKVPVLESPAPTKTLENLARELE